MARRKRRKLWYILGGVLVLLIVLMIAKSRGAFGDDTAIEVEVEKVTKRTITDVVTASGRLEPQTEVKISADISGEIVELPVKEGQKVKSGQLLVRIRPDEYQRLREQALAGVNSSQANVANSKAGLAQAQARLEQVKQAWSRSQDLYKQKAISQAEYQQAEAEYKVAQAQLEAAEQSVAAARFNLANAQAELDRATISLQRTAIYAPMDGYISRLNVKLGERVVGTMQMTGTEIMRVADLNTMLAVVDVNENDIVRIEPGDTALVEVDAFRGERFKGVVTEITNSARTEGANLEQITNFPVKIKILESSYSHLVDSGDALPTPFRPGLTAQVDIQAKTVYNAVSVPILAVTLDKDSGEGDSSDVAGSQYIVYLFKDGKVEEHHVEIGLQDDQYIHIPKGLEVGQEVVSGPYTTITNILTDGMKVSRSASKEAYER